MSRIRERVSPAVVLASIAVFLALTGGAYALGKNSVGTKQLKKNAVTTAKIKNRAVTGKKIRLKTLGPVPRVKGHSTFPVRRIVATDGPSRDAAREAAPEVPMFRVGPVTLYAKCFTDTTVNRTYSYLLIKTSRNGVIFEADYDSADGDPDFLNVNTPEEDRRLIWESASADSADLELMHSDETVAILPNRRSFQARLSTAVKNGNLPNGNGPYGAGNVCLVTGDLTMYR